MTRLPDGRREVYPSRDKAPKRRAPDFGPGLNVSVPISFGLPLVVVGIALMFCGFTFAGRKIDPRPARKSEHSPPQAVLAR